jgi:DNA polymerase V
MKPPKFKGFEMFDSMKLDCRHAAKVTGTGIPVSIGFAPTKAPAKVANKIQEVPERTKSARHR